MRQKCCPSVELTVDNRNRPIKCLAAPVVPEKYKVVYNGTLKKSTIHLRMGDLVVLRHFPAENNTVISARLLFKTKLCLPEHRVWFTAREW